MALLKTAKSHFRLTSVCSDHFIVKSVHDVVIRALKHTVVSSPVFRCDGLNIQIDTCVEGPIMVWDYFSFFHTIINLFTIFPPEHHDPVRIETCSMAADWRGRSILEERHWGRNWRVREIERIKIFVFIWSRYNVIV